MRMFNQTGLFRIMVEATSPAAVPAALEQVRAVLTARHDDDEDFTLITQDAMLKTFSAVIDALDRRPRRHRRASRSRRLGSAS